MRNLAKEFHPVVGITAQRAATITGDGKVHGAHVHAGADQPLDKLKLMDMSRNEVRLNLIFSQPLQVFEVEGRASIDPHA